MKQDYSATLESLEREFFDEDPLALINAIAICRAIERPLPTWCYKAIEELFDAFYLETGPLVRKRGKRGWINNKAARDKDRFRWHLVKRARSGDWRFLFGECPNLPSAFEAVAERLVCKENTVRDSYYRVEKLIPAK